MFNTIKADHLGARKARDSVRTGLYDGKMAGTIIKQELETFQTF